MCHGYEIFGPIEYNNFYVYENYSQTFHVFIFDPQILPSSEFIRYDSEVCKAYYSNRLGRIILWLFNPYPTAFPYGNGMVLHFYQQQESSTTKTVHKVINKGLKTYV